MAIRWDDSLALGIEDIDSQHRSIVDNFARISEAAERGEGQELLEEMLEFLREYAESHFATEERYMSRYAYPNMDSHMAAHEEFTRDVSDLKMRLQQEGGSRELLIAVIGKMIRWIVQHIKNHDREMAAYLKEKMLSEG